MALPSAPGTPGILLRRSAAIARLEIRIDDGKPPHRFVLAYLESGVICRFDRRPETAKPGTLVLETLGGLSTCKATDDLSEVSPDKLEELRGLTHCKLDLTALPGTDLLHILSACFALSQDKKAQDYALLKYNCYFFSWTLVMIVARHTVPFVVPSPEDVAERAGPALSQLTSSLTEQMVNLLLNLVLHTVTEFCARLGRSIIGGLRKRGAIVWGLPIGALRFALRHALRYQLNFRLREQLQRKTEEKLSASLNPILQELLVQQDATKAIIEVDKRLWIHKLIKDFRPLVQEQLSKTLWDIILDIISPTTTGGITETGNIPQIAKSRPKFSIRVKRRLIGDFQFVAMWNGALNAALPAAREEAHGKADPSMFKDNQEVHSEVFNIAFKAASQAALKAAQKVTKDTKAQMNNPKREAMWEKFWVVWDDVWDSSRRKAGAMVVQVVEGAAKAIVKLVASHVVKAVGNNHKQQFVAKLCENRSQTPEDKTLSITDFQNNILKLVRTAYIQAPEPYVASIQKAMTRAWFVSRTTYQPFGKSMGSKTVQAPREEM